MCHIELHLLLQSSSPSWAPQTPRSFPSSSQNSPPRRTLPGPAFSTQSLPPYKTAHLRKPPLSRPKHSLPSPHLPANFPSKILHRVHARPGNINRTFVGRSLLCGGEGDVLPGLWLGLRLCLEYLGLCTLVAAGAKSCFSRLGLVEAGSSRAKTPKCLVVRPTRKRRLIRFVIARARGSILCYIY